MRSFKKVWAEFANTKTGYLERERFGRFFAKLSGAFEVKIYPPEYSIPNVLDACRASSEPELNWSTKIFYGVDFGKLEAVLGGLDYAAIRKRRAIYSRLYHEARISDQGRGISFNNMLILLAHHKLIVDGDALILQDLVERTETNKLVTDLVNFDRVRSLLKMISLRRRFLAHKERLLAEQQQQEIPSIVVDTLRETPSPAPPDGSHYGSAPGSPTPERRYHSPDPSFSLDTPARLQRSNRRTSDISMLSTDHGYSSQRSSMEADPQNVLSSMVNSKWGDLMLEAVEDDERM